MEFLVIIAYLVVAFFVWTKIYSWLYKYHLENFSILEWDGEDRLFGILWGGMVALFWPLSVPVFGVAWLARRIPLGFLERFEK